VSPYFLPGEEGMAQIARLRARDVQMSVATNSLADTDEPLVNINYNNYRVEMLRLGVRLYEVSSEQIKRSLNLRKAFRQSRGRLHAKLTLIDREWALIGSLNFDPRSAHINTELGLRLKPGTDQIQWISTDGENVVHDDEPDANLLVRIKLLLFSWFVPTDLL